MGSDKLLPCLQKILDGLRKADPPTTKQLPVEAGISEYLVKLGLDPGARELDCAVGDLTMIMFYYLLCIGEYTTKGRRSNSKQTKEFKLGDIMFFAKDKHSNLRCLPCDAPLDLIKSAEGATMKLVNQKNGWKGVCVYQEAIGDPIHCPVRAVGQQYTHLHDHGVTNITIILAYYHEGKQFNVTSDHTTSALKLAAKALEYPILMGIPIERINTHSLRRGVTNTLALTDY